MNFWKRLFGPKDESRIKTPEGLAAQPHTELATSPGGREQQKRSSMRSGIPTWKD
jgi:hypothetical protein